MPKRLILGWQTAHQGPPTCLAPGTVSMADNSPTAREVGVVSGFKHSAVISHFISIVMTSTPPQITRHSTPEVGDPCPTVESLIFHFFKKEKKKKTLKV